MTLTVGRFETRSSSNHSRREINMTTSTNKQSPGRKQIAVTCAVSAIALIGFTAEAPAEDFDLDALIEAAKGEDPITVYASTGKIKTSAEAFTEKYGIEAIGTKVKGAAQIELVVRESQAGNVVGDVLISSDAAATLAQLVPEGMVESWLPPDLADGISDDAQDPLVVWRDPAVWTYNSDKHDACPVDNIWALTEQEWNRKVAMPDPLNKPSYADWFNQMEAHWDDAIAEAHEAHFGKALDTSGQSATATWVQALPPTRRW